ncbi:MAG: hypothetical protein ABJB09_06035 [Verrucomicrobiota bacterium]
MKRALRNEVPQENLIIKCEPGMSAAIKQALEQTGRYLIKEEPNAQVALHATRWFQPDMILLDTVAGSLATQIQTAATLRNTPVVCLRALHVGNQIATAGILGGYSFFATPTRIDEILLAIEQLLFGDDS